MRTLIGAFHSGAEQHGRQLCFPRLGETVCGCVRAQLFLFSYLPDFGGCGGL